jgi:hypothetical protein
MITVNFQAPKILGVQNLGFRDLLSKGILVASDPLSNFYGNKRSQKNRGIIIINNDVCGIHSNNAITTSRALLWNVLEWES